MLSPIVTYSHDHTQLKSSQFRLFYSGTFSHDFKDHLEDLIAIFTLWVSWLQLEDKSTIILIFRSTLETLSSRVQFPTPRSTYWVDWELGFTILHLLTSYLDNLNRSTRCQHMCLEHNNFLYLELELNFKDTKDLTLLFTACHAKQL